MLDRETIIRLAREAHGALLASGKGVALLWRDDAKVRDVQDFCERFAALVAAAEREACAQRLDAVGSDECAANIRARGESK